MDRTIAFEAGDGGSNPSGGTQTIKEPVEPVLLLSAFWTKTDSNQGSTRFFNDLPH